MISDKSENANSTPQAYNPRNSANPSNNRRQNYSPSTSPDMIAAHDALRERQLAGLHALLAMSTPVADFASTGPLYVPSKPKVAPRRVGVQSLLRDQALRGAVSLMLSVSLAGVMSFIFWSYTTHHQNASAVGVISAEVASITFLAAVSSLNLSSIFGRFLPIAGWRSRRLITRSYAAVSLTAIIVSTIFLMTPLAKSLIIGGQFGRIGFLICVVLNSIFNVQDGGLIGFGRFGWILVENVSVALSRLALLPLTALFMPAEAAILWSWALPMVIAVLVVNAFLIGPLAERKKREQPSLPKLGKLGRIMAVGSVSSAVMAAATSFLPALVTHHLGSEQGGYFYVPWTITTMTVVLMSNIMISMVREVVANPSKAGPTIRRSIALTFVIVFLTVVACSFLGRLLLFPLGPAFVTHGAPLLQWIGFAMPATAVIALSWSVYSIRQRPLPGLLINLMVSGGIISGVLLLRAGTDISRVGMIYCIVEWSAAALISLPTFLALRAIVDEGNLVRNRRVYREVHH